MKSLTVKDGNVYLDGEKVECLKEFKIVSSAKDNGVAELTIVMDVSLVDKVPVPTSGRVPYGRMCHVSQTQHYKDQ